MVTRQPASKCRRLHAYKHGPTDRAVFADVRPVLDCLLRPEKAQADRAQVG